MPDDTPAQSSGTWVSSSQGSNQPALTSAATPDSAATAHTAKAAVKAAASAAMHPGTHHSSSGCYSPSDQFSSTGAHTGDQQHSTPCSHLQPQQSSKLYDEQSEGAGGQQQGSTHSSSRGKDGHHSVSGDNDDEHRSSSRGNNDHYSSNDRDLRSLEAGSVGAHVEAVQSSFQM